jgi:hypothetical protein
MVQHPADRIADAIVGFGNGTSPDVLARAIARHLDGDGCADCVEIVAGIIRRVDPDQTMGAHTLAEAVWGDLTSDVPPSLRVLVDELDDTRN